VFGKRTSPGSDAPSEVLAPPAPQRAAPAPAESLPAPAAGADLGRALPAAGLGAPIVSPPTAPTERRSPPAPPAAVVDSPRSQGYYEVKAAIFNALIEAIDLAQLARLDAESAREEIRDIVNEIIAIKSIVAGTTNGFPPLCANAGRGFWLPAAVDVPPKNLYQGVRNSESEFCNFTSYLTAS
jgi:pilus assembly protein CpaF